MTDAGLLQEIREHLHGVAPVGDDDGDRFYDLVIDRLTALFVPDAGPPPAGVLRLMPDGRQWPRSSLAHMYDRMGGGRDVIAGVRNVSPTRYSLAEDEIIRTLEAYQRSGRQLIILSTSYALVQLLDVLEQRGAAFELSEWSCVVDTGGYKGRREHRPARRPRSGERVELREHPDPGPGGNSPATGTTSSYVAVSRTPISRGAASQPNAP